MRFPTITLRLPDWVEDLLADPDRIYPTVEDRMRFAIELSWANIQYGAGGPFGATIGAVTTPRAAVRSTTPVGVADAPMP